jgi:cytochrome c biogenesis protein CcdA
MVNRPAPDFTLTTFKGTTISLEDLRGKPVVINFWASWCPPCRIEAPLIERTWRAYKKRGPIFIGVNIQDRKEDALNYIREFDITYPNGPDPTGEIAIDYGVSGLPVTFFVSSRGEVVMNALAVLLPFGYSFGAGMVSTVNPCGFSMLPAYLSLYLGGRHDGTASRHFILRGGKALLIGTAVTLGFTVLFSFFGVILWAGGYILMQYLPWLGLFVGATLASLGLFLLAGKSIHTALPARLANRMGTPESQGFKTYFIFGIGYGMASLGCTLPVFLVVVGSAIKSQGFSNGLFQFFSYSLGMGAVLTAKYRCSPWRSGDLFASYRALYGANCRRPVADIRILPDLLLVNQRRITRLKI